MAHNIKCLQQFNLIKDHFMMTADFLKLKLCTVLKWHYSWLTDGWFCILNHLISLVKLSVTVTFRQLSEMSSFRKYRLTIR